MAGNKRHAGGIASAVENMRRVKAEANRLRPVAVLRVFDIRFEDGSQRRHDAHAINGCESLPLGDHKLYADPCNVIGRQRDALRMVLDIAQRRTLFPAEVVHVQALLAEGDEFSAKATP